MNRTKIEYVDYSWSPIKMRCTPISAGCSNCWHLRFAHRHAANPTFDQRARDAYAGKTFLFDDDEWTAPAKLRKPAKIAVQLMGDLFHDDVPTGFIEKVFFTMLREERHTFMVLTKRPGRMLHYIRSHNTCQKHIWLGVSVEDKKTAYERIPILLLTPAAVRWISVEPMLGDVNLQCLEDGESGILDVLYGSIFDKGRIEPTAFPRLDWVVCGAETGPKKRPCSPEWIDSLRQQCKAVGVPFFGKVGDDGKPIGPREYPR